MRRVEEYLEPAGNGRGDDVISAWIVKKGAELSELGGADT